MLYNFMLYFSGLLLTYLTLKQMKKSKGKINWFLFYFHRFWRLVGNKMVTEKEVNEYF